MKAHESPRSTAKQALNYTNSFELLIRFHLWWQSHRREPTIDQIAEKWGICRSTAYRWRNGYLAALGRVGETQ